MSASGSGGKMPAKEAEEPDYPEATILDRNAQYQQRVDNSFKCSADSDKYNIPKDCMARPPTFNQTGQAVTVAINSYAVLKVPDRKVYQYDVKIGNGTEKRGLVMALWDCETVQDGLGPGWVFDGNRLAWHFQNRTDNMIWCIDMDKERGRTPRPGGKPNEFNVVVKKSGAVNLAALEGYVSGKIPFQNSVLEAITFVDHLMRETPSRKLLAFRRSFFHPKMDESFHLGAGASAIKGVYQSLRPAEGGKMIVNVDIANGVYWSPNLSLTQSLKQVTNLPEEHIIERMKPVQMAAGRIPVESRTMALMGRFKKLRFTVTYPGMPELLKGRVFQISHWLPTNSRITRFEWVKNRTTGEAEVITIHEYFRKKYGLDLMAPSLPIVQTTKKGVMFPPEVCHLVPGQRYMHKLDESQTSQMIRFAVTRPPERLEGIKQGLDLLNWAEDKYHTHYGLEISPNMIKTQARLLNPPEVHFANSSVKPLFAGRWNLEGHKFLLPNPKDLRHWGVAIMNGMGRDRIEIAVAQEFIRKLVDMYRAHGGKIGTPQPPVIAFNDDTDSATATTMLHEKIMKSTNGPPQLMVFMLASRIAEEYTRIKKSADCRYGCVSQILQNVHVIRKQSQYISNVLMKINAKLGGTTARVPGKFKETGYFKVPTIIIGADVSHASPGSTQPSMAAMTVSMDRLACRYAAACESNGHRVEMISTWNMEDMLKPLFREWMSSVGRGAYPHHLMYFRDGVSEAQFQHVLAQEVRDLKAIWREMDGSATKSAFEKLKITVVVASKRHHIRFFPSDRKATDKNGNPHPGTLVERDVTHPFEYDFYLNSHSAIQGTARPTHYHVLMDEMNMPPSDLQNMIYEHCYQYMRSSTPVSLYPAVYYAHLASKRAVAHERRNAELGKHKATEEVRLKELLTAQSISDATGKVLTDSVKNSLKELTRSEWPQLIMMNSVSNIGSSMWYI